MQIVAEGGKKYYGKIHQYHRNFFSCKAQWAGRRTLKISKIWQMLFCIEVLLSNKSFVILTRKSGSSISIFPLVNPQRAVAKYLKGDRVISAAVRAKTLQAAEETTRSPFTFGQSYDFCQV